MGNAYIIVGPPCQCLVIGITNIQCQSATYFHKLFHYCALDFT